MIQIMLRVADPLPSSDRHDRSSRFLPGLRPDCLYTLDAKGPFEFLGQLGPNGKSRKVPIYNGKSIIFLIWNVQASECSGRVILVSLLTLI